MAARDWSRVRWFKSRHSGADGCVECAIAADAVGLRDSKDPAGPTLTFDHATWMALIADIKRGVLDRPDR
jgi:uncharacterized protein DUF397